MAVSLSVSKLLALVDPFSNPSPWGCRGLTLAEVRRAIRYKQFCLKHTDPYSRTKMTRQDHIRRIAYLTVHVSDVPIDIDVGVPSLGCSLLHPLQDGHHRLAAAIVRGDTHIFADVSGSLAYARELFGVNCTQSTRALRSKVAVKPQAA